MRKRIIKVLIKHRKNDIKPWYASFGQPGVRKNSAEKIYSDIERRVLSTKANVIFNLSVKDGTRMLNGGIYENKADCLLMLALFLEDFLRPSFLKTKEEKYNQ